MKDQFSITSTLKPMVNLSNVKVGDELFVVRGRTTFQIRNNLPYNTEMASVAKVGRKYIYLTGFHEPITMDGKSWHGEFTYNVHSNGHGFHAYFLQGDWEQERRNEQAREEFRKRLKCDWVVARDLPIDAILRINGILDEV